MERAVTSLGDPKQMDKGWTPPHHSPKPQGTASYSGGVTAPLRIQGAPPRTMHTHTVANLTGFPDHSESTLGPLWHLWEPLNSGKRPFVFLTDWVCCLSIFLIHLCRPAPCVLSHSVVSGSLRPMGCSPSGSSIHGISQARILEWVAIPFSRGSF